jgi:coenzyme F420-0:L-glutamate ligase/coenzyme F420-1:gamma-L-glutamate ligase
MRLTLSPLAGIPLINPGDDLSQIILTALATNAVDLEDGDILVVGQKIVSKAEGRAVDLVTITPGEDALKLASQTNKDPRLVELVLRETRRVIRAAPGVIVVEHKLGFVCANAGIDHSNVAAPDGTGHEWVLLLPCDPDRSASSIRRKLQKVSGKQLGVVINDSHGRPWRLGTVGACIGLSGIPALIDERGWPDLYGYTLRATIVAAADELAAAASLVMGQAAERTPIVHARGFPYALGEGSLGELIRPEAQDLFR